MTQQHLRYGAADDDGTGDKLRRTFERAESNFSELYQEQARISTGADPDLDTFAKVRAVISAFYVAVNGIPSPAEIQASIDDAVSYLPSAAEVEAEINAATAAIIAQLQAALAAGPVGSVNTKTGIVVLTAADVGAVTQSALDAVAAAKADKTSVATRGQITGRIVALSGA